MLAAAAAFSSAAVTFVAIRAGLATGLATPRRCSGPAASAGLGATGDEAPYTPPEWAPASLTPPATRLLLAHLPTPLHRWALPKVAEETEVRPHSRAQGGSCPATWPPAFSFTKLVLCWGV